MILEKNLNQLFSRLNLFFKKLHPHRLHSGKYIEGEPFDYLIIREGETYCFDAKECKQNALYSTMIPLHQFNDMIKAEKHGAIVFFLIYFVKHKKLKFVHPRYLLDNGKATPDCKEVNNKLKMEIVKWLKQ